MNYQPYQSILTGVNPLNGEEINMLVDLCEQSVDILKLEAERVRFRISSYLPALPRVEGDRNA